jgi:hypothetical protein
MNPRVLWACALVLALAAPARAGEVQLSIKNGHVSLVARDATLREILLEWERVGGTRIVNRDRVPGTRLNIELPNVTEEQALTTLLRPIAGYMASRRLSPEGGASVFSRLILMPGEATPLAFTPGAPAQAVSQPAAGAQPAMGGPPFGRPGMQRRVLPDGRVVTVMDEPQQADDPDEAAPANAPGMMRPPFNAPGRGAQGQAGDTAQQPEVQPGQAAPTLQTAPTAPPVTVTTPGALPVTKPPQTPTKPPGD